MLLMAASCGPVDMSEECGDILHGMRPVKRCKMYFDCMIGDGGKRYCADCGLNVYDTSELPDDEFAGLIARDGHWRGGPLFRRPDGTITVLNCCLVRAERAHFSNVVQYATALSTVLLVCIGLFSFARCRLSQTLSDSFSVVVSQLHCINVYPADAETMAAYEHKPRVRYLNGLYKN
jgi:hypothetical protein